jgi:peptide/nickel transport system permease protein
MNPAVARLIGVRAIAAIPILILVAAMLFGVLRVLPVDPAVVTLPPTATRADIELRRTEMGLDKPLPVQFGIWLAGAVRGDLGRSSQRKEPVVSLIAVALPQTIELAAFSMILASVIGVGGALLMFAARNRPAADGLLDVGSLGLLSIPDFLWALVFILLFGVYFDLLPVTGRMSANFSHPEVTGFLTVDSLIVGGPPMFLDVLVHMIMPVTALGLAFSATIMRVLRSSLQDTYQEDFIHQARLRGLSEGQILRRHGLPNAFLPTLNLMGVQFGFLFGGTLLIEVIFAFPGIGFLMVNAVKNVDFPVIQGVGLIYCLAVIVITVAVDALNIVLNPRLGSRA